MEECVGGGGISWEVERLLSSSAVLEFVLAVKVEDGLLLTSSRVPVDVMYAGWGCVSLSTWSRSAMNGSASQVRKVGRYSSQDSHRFWVVFAFLTSCKTYGTTVLVLYHAFRLP